MSSINGMDRNYVINFINYKQTMYVCVGYVNRRKTFSMLRKYFLFEIYWADIFEMTKYLFVHDIY